MKGRRDGMIVLVGYREAKETIVKEFERGKVGECRCVLRKQKSPKR